VVAERAAAGGISVEDALWGLFRAMLARGLKGDTTATKVLLDRLCDSDPLAVDLRGNLITESAGPPMPNSERMQVYLERFAELAAARRGEGRTPAAR
jgi:hypothetical protein